MIRPGGRALARANALANALALARDLACDFDQARVSLTRVNALAHALARANALNTDRAVDLDRVLDLGGDLTVTLANALHVDRAVNLDRARGLAGDLIGELVELDPAVRWAGAVGLDAAWSTPGRIHRGLVALAVWLLPAPQRPRYHAEFHVELVELPREQRLGYSMRVLAGAGELRWALVMAARSADRAAARRVKR